MEASPPASGTCRAGCRRYSLNAPVMPTPAATPNGWHELTVANPAFLLERLGSDCSDVQGLRELMVNGLDAIAVLGADRAGRVVWDRDWDGFVGSGGRVWKPSVVDAGRK